MLPVKLLMIINKNSEYMKGKYTSYEAPIWSLTIEFKLANKLSILIDHLDGIILLLLLLK